MQLYKDIIKVWINALSIAVLVCGISMVIIHPESWATWLTFGLVYSAILYIWNARLK